MAHKKYEREKKYEVYLIECEVSGKLYVGKTVYTAHARWLGHIRASKKCSNSLLCRAINKYGADKFRVTVLYQGSSEREIFAVEKAMIAQYGTMKPMGYNICAGGQGSAGRPMSEENRATLSAIMIGNTRGKFNKGVKHSEQAVANNSAAQKKLTISPETRKKMADSKRGKKRPHVGASISAAKLGRPSPRLWKAVICVTNDTIYRSVKTACNEMGLSIGSISWALSHESRSAGGNKFVYAVPK